MIKDKNMKFVKSEDGMDYYVFSPTLFRQYYNKTEEWTAHRGKITHKLHMFLYHILGNYKVLYMLDGEHIAAYIVFSRCGKAVIEGSTRKDVFTVFVTTHPDYRRRGLATKIVHEMLYGIGLEYDNSYKTIVDGNTGSINAALANGYQVLYPAKKGKLMGTITKSDDSNWRLYICK